jgi:hypothetical protein
MRESKQKQKRESRRKRSEWRLFKKFLTGYLDCLGTTCLFGSDDPARAPPRAFAVRSPWIQTECIILSISARRVVNIEVERPISKRLCTLPDNTGSSFLQGPSSTRAFRLVVPPACHARLFVIVLDVSQLRAALGSYPGGNTALLPALCQGSGE